MHSSMTRVAKERIEILFNLAYTNTKNNQERRAKRYVELLRAIAARHKIRIPREYRRSFCRTCNAFLIPGRNVVIRFDTRAHVIEYRCTCGSIRRFRYKR